MNAPENGVPSPAAPARHGICPVCGEALLHDSEEEVTFCPFEESRHPDVPSRLAVQATPPGDSSTKFLVGAMSVDGRTSQIEVVIHDPIRSAEWAAGMRLSEVAERLARSLIAAGARRATYHFGAPNTDPGDLDATLLSIKDKGASAFTTSIT